MKKKCIVHMPFYIDLELPSGSQIRPIKIIEAFKNIGYDVDLVTGYGVDRKKQIKYIKDNILNGVKYDFLYSESSTEPTILTEKNHIPKYPFMDFGFLRFCKKKDIKIGLFYRDIHWRFSQYKNNVSFIKRVIANIFYRYDLWKYKSLLDILYLPSKLMYNYIPFKFDGIIEELPPAVNKNKILKSKEKDNSKNNFLNIFYVGGVNKELYNLESLMNVVNKNKFLRLTICCREKEWISAKKIYKTYINDNIKIVHKSGENLIPYFQESDVVNLFIKPTEYWKFAMPVKLFNYIAFAKPIIGVKGTAAGEFIRNNNIGWVINYDEKSLKNILVEINNNRSIIKEKEKNERIILDSNTWDARTKKVARDLTNLMVQR